MNADFLSTDVIHSVIIFLMRNAHSMYFVLHFSLFYLYIDIEPIVLSKKNSNLYLNFWKSFLSVLRTLVEKKKPKHYFPSRRQSLDSLPLCY